ncbi:MAG: alpha-L-arabinofuranosidase C-terminal domain-containing protein [Armatimonadota bacterium]|nr:alpha-L-arabinofuranosidase C-terminal domain-containing protein [Armatimonadota bacterium]
MLQATITVDADNRVGRIDRNIYGHFIEHLGRCINGGIWGEMLQGRRFVGFDDDHNGLPDPWQKVGDRAPQLLTDLQPEGPGRNALRMRCLRDAELHAVRHPGLAVRRGVRYSVQLEIRVAQGEIREVEMALGGAREVRAAPGSEWERWEVELPGRWDSDEAALTIGCRGRGEMQVRDVSLMTARDRETGGYRVDVLELVRAISPPVIRWPGGCFADGYRWRDAVGSRSERPAVYDPAWRAWEPNDFGTDEFVAWCRMVGAQPYICVNTGSAGAEEAAACVEYCNGPADTEMGRLRAAHGNEEPLDVRYWSVGNETYGGWEIGNVPAEEYGRLFVEFAEAMRGADPEIELIAVGADPVRFPDWNRTVLEIAGEQIDHLSVHRYVPHTRDDEQRERQYRAIVAAPVDIERRLAAVGETIEEVLGPDSEVKIAFDEWNVWLDATGDEGIEERYELRDAVFAAGVFNALHRLSPNVSMANLAQLVNVLPAIVTSQTGAWGTAIYRAFELYAGNCGQVAVACDCEGPTFDTEAFGNIPALSEVPVLDASATVADDGDEVIVSVVNRSPTEGVEAEIVLFGVEGHRLAEASILNGQSEAAWNDETRPAAVCVHTEKLEPMALPVTYRFPPHSATILRLRA